VISAVESELGSDLDVVSAEEALANRIRTAVDGAVSKAQEEVTGSSEIDTQPLRDAALAELLEIGPLGAVMEDENITQVQVVLRDLVVHRRGRRVDHGHFGFGSEAGVARALMRMCAKAGVELRADQPFVELELEQGRQLFAVRPGASPQGHILTIRRPQRRQASLDSMVRSGAISRGMATLLAHCVAARANILVAGGAESGAWELVAALAGAVPRHARAVWLRDRAGLDTVPEGSASIELGSDSQERLAAIGAASKVAAEHLVVPALAGHELTALLDAITQGTEGVVMCTVAGTLRQALDRLSADISANRAGVSVETAREWLGATFDLGLEVTRLRDGRLRVVRLAELRSGSQGTSVRDVFTFSYHRTAAGGSIEGSFYASGTVPRIVEDLAARGMPLDTSIFRRHPNA
jgi:pilus assembly protein CpaF